MVIVEQSYSKRPNYNPPKRQEQDHPPTENSRQKNPKQQQFPHPYRTLPTAQWDPLTPPHPRKSLCWWLVDVIHSRENHHHKHRHIHKPTPNGNPPQRSVPEPLRRPSPISRQNGDIPVKQRAPGKNEFVFRHRTRRTVKDSQRSYLRVAERGSFELGATTYSLQMIT